MGWFTKPPRDKTPPEPESSTRELTVEEIEAELATQLTDELDLHHFQPREVADVVTEYLHAAREAGFERVRIIHGKGTGTLRTTVHAWLRRAPGIASFRLADESAGSWGATVVTLQP